MNNSENIGEQKFLLIHKLIGSKLPGSEDNLGKGIRLALGIHQSNPQLILQFGKTL